MSNLGKEKSKAEQLQEELFLKPKHAMRGGLADAEIERADQLRGLQGLFKFRQNGARSRWIFLPQGRGAGLHSL